MTKEELKELMTRDKKDFFKSINKELPTIEEIMAIRDCLKYWCETLKLDFTVNEKAFDRLLEEVKNSQLDN